jgi:hypothetical protein
MAANKKEIEMGKKAVLKICFKYIRPLSAAGNVTGQIVSFVLPQQSGTGCQ